MRMLGRLGTLPIAVTVLTGITAVYYLLVVWGNIEGYDVNHGLVEGVFAMDTLFPAEQFMTWRAVTSGGLVHTAYILIIVWEALITLVLVAALVTWLRALAAGRAGPGRFELAKRLSTLGWTMVVLLFAGGFITIGGEWFLIWQSEFSDVLQTATNNFLIASVGIIMAQLVRGDETTAPEPADAEASS